MKLTVTFKLVEPKKVLARYDEQPDEHGAYAGNSPKPVFGTIYPRMSALGPTLPAYLVLTIET